MKEYTCWKLPLSQKLHYFRGSCFPHCFILSTALQSSLPSQFFKVMFVLSNYQTCTFPLKKLINVRLTEPVKISLKCDRWKPFWGIAEYLDSRKNNPKLEYMIWETFHAKMFLRLKCLKKSSPKSHSFQGKHFSKCTCILNRCSAFLLCKFLWPLMLGVIIKGIGLPSL